MSEKIYLVTGVSSGIGFQVAKSLLESGLKVIGNSRKVSSKVQSLLTEFPDHFHSECYELAEDIDSLPSWIKQISQRYGRLAGFVHSAGVQQIIPLKANSYRRMLQVFDINLFASLAIARAVADKRVNTGTGVSIVFISSIAAKIGSAGTVNYSASKAALNGAMRVMAKELSSQNIRVNCVLPGFIKTELTDKWKDVYHDEYISKMEDCYPLGIGSADDVANIVKFLLGDEAKWITGGEFTVDGGITLGVHE